MTFPIKCLSLRQIQVLGQCEQCGFSQRTSTSQFSSFPKGQLISKCPFGVFKSTKKNFFARISALARVANVVAHHEKLLTQ